MRILKNRTVIGIFCILLSLVICFVLTPMFNEEMSRKESVIRVVKDIKSGEKITEKAIETVEVGGYNLPKDIIKSQSQTVGKYATKDMTKGDYVLKGKVSNSPAAENSYLYSLDGEKQAMSVSVKSFANGLSGKLQSGDIVSVIAPDFRKLGTTEIPNELQYVEVIAVTATSGVDANTGEQSGDETKSEEEEKELPSTVTLLVGKEQSKVLAELESDGQLHLSLVYRGTKDNSLKFIEAQNNVLTELYPLESGEGENGQPAQEQQPEETDTGETKAEGEQP